ncbi:putative transferase, protein kinase RLK-Pelle-LRR-III family [Helianthus annuus]|uniref:Transferase, protein kinase RLK-Pelle-LRR-III family n=1 Tax=Helianthus annuus TaxID=4232 RepID=A0A9K3JNI9_HELAN|nr:putative transferase, protein kinase RLK-Pelle-LRR-III family [Helianthus annuus]KAJ0604638.1 putative transferase, protein kinase RLK-Pelle-LRR-III family [Helianthus annuus]KAJ0939781.1 putative transferase, protein kinase RLK-Pelle-LRR-III family [Helianthus annuus]
MFFDGRIYSFDLEDLLRASVEVLGKGSVGTSYKAVLEEGTTVVVKRVKDVVVTEKEFEAQMEILGKMKNGNVVPLRAFYYSKDEKLLVSDFMPAGSLYALLHGNNNNNFFILFTLLSSTFSRVRNFRFRICCRVQVLLHCVQVEYLLATFHLD